MNEPTNPAINATTESQLTRLRWFHRVNAVLFWLSMLGIFGGLAVFSVSESVGTWLMVTGFALAGFLVLESYAIYPRLKCPRCKHRFFLPDGGWHWLARINVGRGRCLHCGLSYARVDEGVGDRTNASAKRR